MVLRHVIENWMVRYLPVDLYRWLGGAYGFLVPPKKSYSQYGEDLIVWNFFHYRKRAIGIYVDIGGFHPRWLSNTHLLSRKGWRGVVVDVDDRKIDLCERTRSECLGIVAAVFPGERRGRQTVYKFRRLWSEIDTLSKADAEKYRRDTGLEYDATDVQTIHINDVLEKAQTSFDGVPNFLNIDIEGLDEAILFELDFKRFPVDFICFENNAAFAGSERLQLFLGQKGYKHVFTSWGTHGYARLALL